MRRETHEFLERRSTRRTGGFPLALIGSVLLHAGVLGMFVLGARTPVQVTAPVPPQEVPAPAPEIPVAAERPVPAAPEAPREPVKPRTVRRTRPPAAGSASRTSREKSRRPDRHRHGRRRPL